MKVDPEHQRCPSVFGTKVSMWASCSGCTEFGDEHQFVDDYKYDRNRGCHLGSGCEECGNVGAIFGTYVIPYVSVETGDLSKEDWE